MNKVILGIIVLFLSFPAISYGAPENSTRSMAAEQLFQYAKAIYDRGDKAQANQIFARVLVLDPKHPGALHYARPLNVRMDKSTSQSVEIAPVIEQTNAFLKMASVETITGHIEPKTNASLEQHIQEVDQAIGMLQNDITHLRTQLAQETEHSQNNDNQGLSN